MDKFVIRLNATPSTSTTTACTSSTVDSPPPSPAEQPPVKKAKPSVKVTPPQRETSVDWRSRVILSDDDEVGFLNSQEEFENLYSEGNGCFPHPLLIMQFLKLIYTNNCRSTHPLLIRYFAHTEPTHPISPLHSTDVNF